MAKHCDVCNIYCIDDYSYHGHLMGKKHVNNVKKANHKKQLKENSIFLAKIPPQINHQTFIEFFRQFGSIKSHKFGQSSLIIEYNNKESADYLLSRPIYFEKWKLLIKERVLSSPHNKKPAFKKGNNRGISDTKNDQLIERLKLLEELKSESSWPSQLERFLTSVQGDDAAMQARCTEVCNSVNSIFAQSFPHGRTVRFGSTVTGLYTKHSDMDIFYDIGEMIYDQEQIDGQNEFDQRKKWTPKSIFTEVKLLLYRNNIVFSKVIPIPLAKTPVIKFHHNSCNVDCDITFKNDFGVHNSQLIKHYLSLDHRLKPLMVIIKYWAKSLDLTGTGKITNYSLVMAVICYLQQKNVNLLPTVKELQTSCEPVYSGNWQVNFNRNIRRDTSNNKSTIPELLHGFFTFYDQFNFSDNVISPFDGLVVRKDDFIKKLKELNLDKNCSFSWSKPACIQDPFKLNYNIAEGWLNYVRSFQKNCKNGIYLCELSAKDNNISLLPFICDPQSSATTNKSIQIAIPAGMFKTFGLPEDFDTCTTIKNKELFIENNWFNVVHKLFRKILTDIFKLDVQDIFNETNQDKITMKDDSALYSESYDKIVLMCTGKYCVNRGRRNYTLSIDPSLSYIKKETLISDKIVAELEKKKEFTTFHFKCTLKKKANSLHVLATLTNEEYNNKLFKEIGDFMRSKIPSIINKELVHMIQYKEKLL